MNKLVEKFSPIDVVKQYPLIQSSSIHISPGITTDTSSLDAVLVGVLAKIKWVNDNVDSLERCSGFPSLYFDEQKIVIDSMLNKWVSVKHNNSKFDKFFNDLLLIKKSGYLNEYIYDEFGCILLLPKGLILDFDNYQKWKKIHNPTVRLTGQYYYLIGYEDSYEDKK